MKTRNRAPRRQLRESAELGAVFDLTPMSVRLRNPLHTESHLTKLQLCCRLKYEDVSPDLVGFTLPQRKTPPRPSFCDRFLTMPGFLARSTDSPSSLSRSH